MDESFRLYKGRMDMVKIVYLQQVSGYLPYVSNKLDENKFVVDPLDNCFDTGDRPPTIFSLPSKYTKRDTSDVELD